MQTKQMYQHNSCTRSRVAKTTAQQLSVPRAWRVQVTTSTRLEDPHAHRKMPHIDTATRGPVVPKQALSGLQHCCLTTDHISTDHAETYPTNVRLHFSHTAALANLRTCYQRCQRDPVLVRPNGKSNHPYFFLGLAAKQEGPSDQTGITRFTKNAECIPQQTPKTDSAGRHAPRNGDCIRKPP
jgi:hypothetical protein